MVKCMAVSGDGRHVALGGEDGSVTIVAVPDMHTEASIRCLRGSSAVLLSMFHTVKQKLTSDALSRQIRRWVFGMHRGYGCCVLPSSR